MRDFSRAIGYTLPEEEADLDTSVHFRTQEGNVGTLRSSFAASELYVHQFAEMMLELYKETGFVNDIKIVVNYKDADLDNRKVLKYTSGDL